MKSKNKIIPVDQKNQPPSNPLGKTDNIIIYCILICACVIIILFSLVYLDNIWNYTKFAGISGSVIITIITYWINRKDKSNPNDSNKPKNRMVSVIVISLLIAAIFNCVTPITNAIQDMMSKITTPPEYEDMTFILDDDSELDPNIYHDIVYFKDKAEAMEHLELIKSALQDVSSDEEYYTFYDTEAQFYDKCAQAERYKKSHSRDNHWYSLLPNESEIECIIDEEENQVTSAPSYELYHRISKNYMTISTERINQHKSEKIRKYLERASICVIESIKYLKTEEQFRSAIEDLYTIYTNLLNYCNLNIEESDSIRNILISINAYLNK